MNDALLQAADEYRRRGWSILPVNGKQAAVKWRRFKRKPPSSREVSHWYGNGHAFTGIAVIGGKASDGLAIRDFDDQEAYKAWYDRYPDLADALPTVATANGAHVYCRAKLGSLQAVRRSLGSEGDGAIVLLHGELRADVGCYTLTPPSKHPEGPDYRWVRPLPGELPIIDLREFVTKGDKAAAKLSHSTQSSTVTQHTQSWHTCNAVSAVCPAQSARDALADPERAFLVNQSQSVSVSGSKNKFWSDSEIVRQPAVALAISTTLPLETGQRNRCLFKLAQKLRAIPELVKRHPVELRAIVQVWHHYALPVIATKQFEESWSDFCTAWSRVIHPSGKEPIAMSFSQAISEPLPTAAELYETAECRALVALCRQLQREAGDQPFYLAGRKAAELVGAPHRQVARWLKMFVVDKVLALETAGKRHRASEYRYVAGD